MEVTKLGIIQTIKNIGLFLGTYTVAGIQANPEQFYFALVIYILISVPSDLYLLNKAHESAKTSTEGSEK